MSTGKTANYIKYAIGEILLVVVGILIALSVNNWNQERISSKRETVILKSLKSELITNLKELRYDLKSYQYIYQSTLDVYSYIQNKPEVVDSMYEDFYNCVGFNYFFPKTSTYETLKSGKMELIKSDSLKEIITDIYESDFKRILDKVETRRNAARLLFPYYQSHFKTVFSEKIDSIDLRKKFVRKLGIPNNYNFVINDPEFETLIVEAIGGRLNFLSGYKNSIKDVESCLNKIDDYLNE
ncbi:MAG: hypothetical protein KJO49_02795 [Bacteroidia bacterium]|nr:hypothetical protein [Bacteroidia bacterium]